MRIEQLGRNVEVRTKSLIEAAVFLTKGAAYAGVEWINSRDAEFIFSPNGIDIAELSRAYYADEPLPAKTLLGNYIYLRTLVKQSESEIENGKTNRNRPTPSL